MTHKNNKLRNKIWSLALCLCMILSCLPISAFAETADGYVHEHTAECGHNYGEEETTESTETSAPAYTTEDVKAMIDALPSVSELEIMDNDELSEVHAKAQDAYDAFETLTGEEQIELADDLIKLRNVLDYVTEQTMPLAADTGAYAPTREENYRTAGNCIFANGTAITIEFAPNGTRVWYMDGSTKKYVTNNGENGEDLSEWNIFVGSNNDDGMKGVNGSITMTGGKVKKIFAGQYYGHFTGTSNITISGGTITNNIYCNSYTSVSNNDYVGTVTIFDAVGTTISTGSAGYADNVVQKKDGVWSVSGNGVIPSGVTLTVGSGETLTVPKDATLINNGSLVNNGGTITVYGKLTGNAPENYVAPSDFTFSPSSSTLKANVSATLEKPTASTNNSTLVPWFSFEVADVGTTGAVINGTTITPYGAGTVKVKVLMHDGYCTPVEKIYDFSVSFTPVTEISGNVQSEYWVNKDYYLPSAVSPSDASYNTIVWSVVNAGDTGTVINGNKIKAIYGGTVTIRATVKNGKAYGSDFVKDYTVTFVTTETIDIGIGSVTISKKDDSTLTVAYAGFSGGSKEYSVNEPIVITGTSTTNVIKVSGGNPTIVLNNVNMSYGEGNRPITIDNGGTVTLELVGENQIESTYFAYAAISVCGNNLIISGEGKLVAIGGNQSACIGASRWESAGTITINGGTILAENLYGIGESTDGGTGTVIINGGNVKATKITGTLKNANGSSLSLYTITLNGAADDTLITGIEGVNYGINGVKTIGDKLYFYLPSDANITSITTESGKYICKVGNTFYKDHEYSADCDDSCNHCGEKRDISSAIHDYDDNGICRKATGEPHYQPAEYDEMNNAYKIANLGNLLWFRGQVNSGNTKINAILIANINGKDDVAKIIGIGTDDNPFEGVFDGNNKILDIQIVSTELYAAPFAYVNGATIKNLTVTGSITSSKKYAASIIGLAKGGTVTLEKCISKVTITSTVSGDGTNGGMVANVGGGELKINNCAFVGAYVTTTATNSGGFVGWTNQAARTYITSSFLAADFSGAKADGCNTFSRNPDYVTVENCYYLTAFGDVPNGATQKNAGQFASGEVAWLLNGSDNGAWKQTLKTDTTPNFSGEAVYKITPCETGYTNNESEKNRSHSLDEHGSCTNCNKYHEIDTVEKLVYFAQRVNAGECDINAKLMANIDVSTISTFGIGTSENPYTGTFNGNGYTITISLRSSTRYLALFPYVNGATIQNLTVDGIIVCSDKYAASIVGSAKGNVTIENCISSVTIKSTLVSDGTHGGLVGVAESGGTLTINNCAFIGAIKGTDTTSCGGFVGWANGTVTISNSFVAATFTVSASGSCTYSRNPSNVTLNNCYYLDALGTVQGTKITAAQLANGNLAWFLNGSKDNGIWKQTINKDKTPNFSGKVVYKASPCEIYVNSKSEKAQEHIVENGVCKNCGKIISDYAPAIWNSEQNTYEIHTISQLFWFANQVNNGNYSINGKLMADLDLSGYTWTPIAYLPMSDSATIGYSGVFDGNGHVIRNITIITPTSDMANGLFGIITTGTVKHLGIDNLYFDNNDYDHRAGGVAGQLMSGGTIENCFVINSTIKASSRVVGGIVGRCKGTVKNCYTANLTLEGYKNRFGGITGDYADGSIINCYTDYATLGSTTSSVGTVDSLSEAGISTAVFTSGKIAYLLNGSTSDGSLMWYQTCGTGYPVFSGKTVYANVSCGGYTYANTKQAGNTEHSYVNGFCRYCDAYQPAEKNIEGYYEIFNAGQLYWFAALTNGELDGFTQDRSANAILVNDIIVNTGVIVNGALASNTNGFRNWTPIGNYSDNGNIGYIGTFNGNGHTISGLYMLAQVKYSGFIGYVSTGSTIKNLTVADSYFKTTQEYMGAISGYNEGTIERCTSVNCIISGTNRVGGIAGTSYAGKINNCMSQNCTVNGNENVGGITGIASGKINNCASVDCTISGTKYTGGIAGILSDMTVSNCYSNSQIKATSERVCGIGWTQYTCTISNCYFTGSITGTTKYVAAITYMLSHSTSDVTVNDCYYISTISVGAANMGSKGTLKTNRVAAKTADQFKSGEVAWLLNGSSSTGVWKQTLSSDIAPNFSGMTVYYDSNSTPQYYNNTTSDKVASVTITWTDMSFSYNKGTWDTDTMTWEGGGWEADAGCGTVSVKNTGNVGVTATFGVNLTDTSYGISVSFTENGTALTDNKLRIAAGNSKFVSVKLTGDEPSEYIETAKTIGQITIALSTE